jgi:hypothetical protein
LDWPQIAWSGKPQPKGILYATGKSMRKNTESISSVFSVSIPVAKNFVPFGRDLIIGTSVRPSLWRQSQKQG